ncbi:hypothetical protein [Alkalilimnicola ehrlichii]|uniref:Flavodoxin-like domain-containing protein n=2 Tax=Alkalilimnicola ehrlichii TaxID=351052 RepID=A0A3E0WJJ3_9GAMM|nr:hypothetical protein [Alkalilimnicola ehrlichii]RFA32267.1 hypothetical protein CAL65_20075 [Alkalilimnicola ehrlichii]
MSTLVVYYTAPGEDREVAEAVARESGAETEFIREVHTAEGLFGFNKNVLWGGPAEEDIGEPTHDPSTYDLVAIGSSVENGHITAPVEAFVKAYRDDLPRVAFF